MFGFAHAWMMEIMLFSDVNITKSSLVKAVVGFSVTFYASLLFHKLHPLHTDVFYKRHICVLQLQ